MSNPVELNSKNVYGLKDASTETSAGSGRLAGVLSIKSISAENTTPESLSVQGISFGKLGRMQTLCLRIRGQKARIVVQHLSIMNKITKQGCE